MAVFAEHIVYKRQRETHQSRSVKDSLGEGGQASRNSVVPPSKLKFEPRMNDQG